MTESNPANPGDSATRDVGIAMRSRVLPAGATRHGVVVGIENYQDRRLNLRCARADAQAIYDLMVDPEIGMFPKDNVKLLLDEHATREQVWRALGNLRRAAGPDDTVWIYYSGHGAPEGDGVYWVTYDADVDDLYGTAISSTDVSRVLSDIKATRLVTFLDCCHAAATTVQKHPTRSVGCAEKTLEAFKGKGRVTFSSSDGVERSVELPELGHGAFTYFLAEGLRGAADAAGDGVVTADKLWTYLRGKVAEVSRKVGQPQTPILAGEMSHDLPLTLNPAAASERQSLARVVEGLIGLGEERLSTDEATYVLDLVLHRAPRNDDERQLLEELKSLSAGHLAVRSFRRILNATRLSRPVPPPVRIEAPRPPPKPPELRVGTTPVRPPEHRPPPASQPRPIPHGRPPASQFVPPRPPERPVPPPERPVPPPVKPQPLPDLPAPVKPQADKPASEAPLPLPSLEPKEASSGGTPAAPKPSEPKTEKDSTKPTEWETVKVKPAKEAFKWNGISPDAALVIAMLACVCCCPGVLMIAPGAFLAFQARKAADAGNKEDFHKKMQWAVILAGAGIVVGFLGWIVMGTVNYLNR